MGNAYRNRSTRWRKNVTDRYDLGRIRILVLEDDEHMRSLMTGVLKALKVGGVLALGEADAALKKISDFGPDLVITDWHMKPIDGLEFVRKVRKSADSPNPYVPIIMVTGHTEIHRVHEARDAGVNELLAKPISAKSLYSRVLSVIENPRPFVRSANYFGPDRRRRDMGPPQGMADRRGGGPGAADQGGDSADLVEI